jgi:hypothetical protein
MTTPSTPYRPTVRTQADLEAVWKHLMGPWGFGGYSIWMLVIGDDDQPYPQITEITEATEPPDDEMLDGLATVLDGLDAPGRRFAFLRSRPGGGGVSADDLAWARALHVAARRAGVACEVVHRATDHDLVAVPMDAVLGGDAA